MQSMATPVVDGAHRPWARPARPWLVAQTWLDLLFAHWPVATEDLRAAVPAALSLDTHAGSAWIGVVPFLITGSRVRGLPSIPSLTTFPETNVRTYVTVDGKPGVYFLSLDATSRLAVLGARRGYGLPYHLARMSCARDGAWVQYASRRVSPDAPPGELRVRYRAQGEPYAARPGSLEHFLVERYCLYVLDGRGRVRRADIDHPPWSLQAAQAAFELNTLALGLDRAAAPVLHFCSRQDALIWSRERVRT